MVLFAISSLDRAHTLRSLILEHRIDPLLLTGPEGPSTLILHLPRARLQTIPSLILPRCTVTMDTKISMA